MPPGEKLRILAVGDGRSIHTIRWLKRLDERGHELRPRDATAVGASPPTTGGTRVYDVRKLERLTPVKRPAPAALRPGDPQPRRAARRGPRPRARHAPVRALGGPGRTSTRSSSAPGAATCSCDAKTEPGRSRARKAFAAADYLVVNSQAILDAAARGRSRPRPSAAHDLAHAARRLLARPGRPGRGFAPSSAGRRTPSSSCRFATSRSARTSTCSSARSTACGARCPTARLLLAARGGRRRPRSRRSSPISASASLVRFHRVERPESCRRSSPPRT